MSDTLGVAPLRLLFSKSKHALRLYSFPTWCVYYACMCVRVQTQGSLAVVMGVGVQFGAWVAESRPAAISSYLILSVHL